MIDVTTNPTRLYERLYVSVQDLGMARQYAEMLLKKGWHSAPWERRGSVYMQQSAFTTALVVCYGRPFTNSKGWPSFPTALLKLTASQAELHFKLLNLRHQVYAHSDSCRYEIELLHNSVGGEFDIVGAPFRKLEKGECQGIVEVTTKAMKNARTEMRRLRPSVSKAME